MQPLTPKKSSPANNPASVEQKELAFRQAAADQNTAAVLSAIKEGGINLSSCGPSGNTALHYACGRNNGEIINALMDAGANIEAVNKNGLRPYEMKGLDHHHYLLLKERQFRKDVAANDIDKVLTTTCQKEINVSSCGASRSTALHYACERDNVEMIMTLVNAGADLELSNKDGILPSGLPQLAQEHAALLQTVRTSKRVLADFDQALDHCTHKNSRQESSTFNHAIANAMHHATKNAPSEDCVLIGNKVTFETCIKEKKFLMASEPLSMLVAYLLVAEKVPHSIEVILAGLKSNNQVGHAFIAINHNNQHPYMLGSSQKVYIVDPLKGKSFFSYIDDQLFLSTDNIPHDANRSRMRTTLLKDLHGYTPSAFDPSEINNLSYGLRPVQNGASQQFLSKNAVALQNETIKLARHLITLMKNGEITVLHHEIVTDRYSHKCGR